MTTLCYADEGLSSLKYDLEAHAGQRPQEFKKNTNKND